MIFSEKSQWWRTPVIAWAISVDRHSSKRTVGLDVKSWFVYANAVEGPHFDPDDSGCLVSSDGDVTIHVIPSHPGTWKVGAYIKDPETGESWNATLGYEHGTQENDSVWDDAILREIESRRLMRQIRSPEA